MFGNLGVWEILIILLVVLLLFGAKRIPEVAGSLGKGITEFKRNMSDAQRQITDGMNGEPTKSIGAERDVPTAPRQTPETVAREDETRAPKRLIG